MTNSNELQNRWAKCCELLRANIGEDRFRIWFAVARPVSFDNGQLVLKLPSAYYADLYEDQFANVLNFALRQAFGNYTLVL